MRFHEIVPILNLLVDRRLGSAMFGRHRDVPDETCIPRTFLLSGDELARVRAGWTAGDEPLASALRRFLAHADELLSLPLLSVREKQEVPEGRSQADYLSLGRYWWPDPESEDGLPYVVRDGQTNPEVYSDRYDLSRFEEFTYRAFVLGFAYALSGDEKFAQRSSELIEHWCLSPDWSQTPNFEFAQMRPGHSLGSGVGVIEAHRLIYVVEAAQMIDGSEHWPESRRIALKAWFSELLTWMRTSRTALAAGKRINNIGTWYDVQCAVYALYTGDRQLAGAIVAESGLRRLSSQMEPGGGFPAELSRTRPYDYFAFNLLAFIALARVGESVDVDLWSKRLPDGRNLEGAVQWLRNVVQPEGLSFGIALRAAGVDAGQGEDDEGGHSDSRLTLLEPLAAEVDALRWKSRMAAAERAELIAKIREQEERADRFLALVLAAGATGEVEQQEGVNNKAADAGDAKSELPPPSSEVDTGALCMEIERLQGELQRGRMEVKEQALAMSSLDRRMREEAVAAELAAALQDELGKAHAKIRALESAVERMVRARAENEGRLRDRFEYLLEDQTTRAEKKLSALKAKERDERTTLKKVEERKRRLVEVREQQAMGALQEAAVDRDRLRLQVVRLQADLAHVKRPLVERLKSRLNPGARRHRLQRERDIVEGAALPRLLQKALGAGTRREALESASHIELERMVPIFAADWYVTRYPTVLLEWESALAEHLAEGGRRGRRPHPLFWSAWYMRRYLKDQPEVCPMIHFLKRSRKKDLDPNPYFDSRWYRKQHMGAREKSTIPLVHYIQHGRKAGLETSPRISLSLVQQQFAAARIPGADALAVFLALPDDQREKLVRQTQNGGGAE